jgi:F0F1-type ATP synthase assembly protein I
MSNAEPLADNPSALAAFRCGILHAIGGFDTNELSGEEQAGIMERKSWFWLGEVVMASLVAAIIAVPAGIFFAGKTAAPLAVIGAVLLFLPLFVFIPKMIRQAVQVDTEAVIAVLGRNEQVKKIFWTLFLAVAGLVLAEIVDPGTAEKIVAALAGIEL